MSAALLDLAKEHFGYLSTAPDCTIPKPYLKELQNHLAQYPWDDKFTIKRQTRQGFGVLTCLEDGCQSRIDLTRLDSERDGGKKGGVGSLSAFRDHIENHPTHKKNCLRRVKANEKQKTAQVDQSSVPMNARGSNAVASRFFKSIDESATSNPGRASAPFPAPDAVAPIVPRKRHSEVVFSEAPSTIIKQDEELAPSSPLKKARYEQFDRKVPPKSPLATNMDLVNHSTALVAQQFARPFEDIQEELRDVLAEISRFEPNYERALRKENKKKGDNTRIATYKAHLSVLYRKRDALKAQLPVVRRAPETIAQVAASAPSSSLNVALPLMGAEMSSAVPHPQYYRPYPVIDSPRPPLKQVIPQINVPANADQKPQTPWQTFVKTYQDERAAPSTSQGPSNPAPTFAVRPQIPPSPLTLVKRENAVASGSRSSPLNPSFGNGTRPMMIVQPKLEATVKREAVWEALPTASSSSSSLAGSKRPSTSPPRPFPCDREDLDMSDSESDGEEREYNDVFASRVLDKVLDKVTLQALLPTRDPYDDDGLFYGRGRDLYVGPQAAVNDINQFLVMAGNAEHFDSNGSVGEALAKLGLRTQYELLPGMEIPLMAHQAIGVAWMIGREASPIKGGCLADDMGLGKTVQMIALMVLNRSPDPARKTNLIIAPLALLDQWKFEIETKTNCGLRVLIYHGSNRPRRKSDLQEYDVVLTTYGTMAMEWPDYEKEAKRKAKAKRQRQRDGSLDDFIVDDSSDGENLGAKVKKRKLASGLLFQLEFYRIILDEAQWIRNRLTRSSRAVNELTATYRWCLTGTPIINSLIDTYGYIRFLKIRPWYDWQEFNGHIGRKEKKNPSLAVTRLQAIMSTYQIRRTKDSKLDGKKLVDLPEKKIGMTALEFTKEEADIYKMVEARSQATFNRYLRAGTVLKNYHQVLVLLLRLRQICSHPCLILEDVGAFVPAEDVDHSKPAVANELSRARKLMSEEFVDEMKAKMKQVVLQRIEAEKKSKDAALEGEDCPICLDVMNENAVVTACKHAFCRECIMDVLSNPIADPVDEARVNKDERPCPVCRGPVIEKHLFKRSAFEPTEKELNPDATSDSDEPPDESDMDVDDIQASRKGKARAKKAKRGAYRGMDDDEYDEDDDLSDFIVNDDEDEDEKDARRALKLKQKKRRANVVLDSDEEMEQPEVQAVVFGVKSKKQLEREALEKMPRFLPSTKMKYMMELIQKISRERPEEKILIISQWTSCLSLVSDYLAEKGIIHVKYQGDMNREKRDQAVRVFMSKDKAKVMLMSLKCGGVGLNLTRANNVVSLDLAWSRAVESQAWDRVHRLGQTRSVNVQRLVIAETVEDRIMALQERKQSLADGSLGEGKGKKMGKLTVRELANLFGLDDRGRVM
ncbi:hypothetical protein H1R20_g266, partial [Candolleomyces eurysporus]